MNVTLSVIASFRHDLTLDSLRPQLDPDDEYIVVGEGGHNAAIKAAKGSHLVFLGEGDIMNPGGIATIRNIVQMDPARPHMFSMIHQGNLLWRTNEVMFGNVIGQMFVPINKPELLGLWGVERAPDFDFIRSTMKKYPRTFRDLAWHAETPISESLAT